MAKQTRMLGCHLRDVDGIGPQTLENFVHGKIELSDKIMIDLDSGHVVFDVETKMLKIGV